MNKTKLILLASGVIVAIVGIAVWFGLRQTADKTMLGGNTAAVKSILDQARDDWGTASTIAGATDISSDPLLDGDILAADNYKNIVSKYRILPQQAAGNKELASLLNQKNIPHYPSPTVKSNFFADINITAELARQKTKIAGVQIPIFTYKTNLAEGYIKGLAQGFGIDNPNIEINQETGMVQASNLAQESAKGARGDYKLLIINPLNGTFIYETLPAEQPNIEEKKNAVEIAQDFLSANHLSDYTAQLNPELTSTYQDKQTEGVTYVSLHRGWGNTLPILNLPGVYSINALKRTIAETLRSPENLSLAAKDENIYATSDQVDALARDNNFNTITLAIENGKVTAGKFSMRPLNSDTAKVGLISASDAIANLNKGFVYSFSAIPLGEGNPNPSATFPAGAFESTDATITSIFLAYAEESSGVLQNTLQPTYIIKGYATAKAGSPLAFAAQTPAYNQSDGAKAKLSSIFEIKAEEETVPIEEVIFEGMGPDSDSAQQIEQTQKAKEGKKQPPEANEQADDKKAAPTEREQTEVEPPAQVAPQPQPAAQDGRKVININGRYYLVEIKGGKVLPDYVAHIYRAGPAPPIKRALDKSEITAKLKEMGVDTSALEQANTANTPGFGPAGNIRLEDIEGLPEAGLYSHHYLGGISPLIHLYSQTTRPYIITPSSSSGKITYAWPPRDKTGAWNITADKNGNLTTAKGDAYSRLYYEFSTRPLVPPKTGFIVEAREVLGFLRNNLLPKLNLTKYEQEEYLKDIEAHILKQTPSEIGFYQISLLTTEEITALLPLEVSPNPAIAIRNFLVFKPLARHPGAINAPVLPAKIERGKYAVVLVENGCALLD